VLIRSSVIPILVDEPIKLPINDVDDNVLVIALKNKLELIFKGVDAVVDEFAVNGIYNDVVVVSVVIATLFDVVDVNELPEHEVEDPEQLPVKNPTNDVVESALVVALNRKLESTLKFTELLVVDAVVNATHKFVVVLSNVTPTFILRVDTAAVPFIAKYLELNNVPSSYIVVAFIVPLTSNKYDGSVFPIPMFPSS
jgi:hypothetical protein